MGETSSQKPPATGITPDIAANQLKKGIVGYSGQYAEIDEAEPSEEYVVRVRKNQTSVAFTLNTKRLVERREIERANELKRRSGS
jgi:hypothetical protein